MNFDKYLLKLGVYTLFSVMLITVNFGCKKGKATIDLHGVIVDQTFSTGLSGATVYLYELDASGSNMTLLGETTTSSEGKYSFSFSRNTVLKYQLEVQKENYFPIEEEIAFSDLSIEHGNMRNYATTAMSWAKLRFVTSSSTSVQYNREQGKIDCESCCPTGVYTITGPVDTSIYCVNDGNSVYSYQYIIAGSAPSVNSVTTVAFDTTEILLQW